MKIGSRVKFRPESRFAGAEGVVVTGAIGGHVRVKLTTDVTPRDDTSDPYYEGERIRATVRELEVRKCENEKTVRCKSGT